MLNIEPFGINLGVELPAYLPRPCRTVILQPPAYTVSYALEMKAMLPEQPCRRAERLVEALKEYLNTFWCRRGQLVPAAARYHQEGPGRSPLATYTEDSIQKPK